MLRRIEEVKFENCLRLFLYTGKEGLQGPQGPKGDKGERGTFLLHISLEQLLMKYFSKLNHSHYDLNI